MSPHIQKQSPVLRMMKICTLCAASGAALTLLLLLVFAIVSFSRIDNPDSYINVFAIVAASAGALAAGFASCKIHRSRGLFCGLICGIEMLVLLFIVSKLLAGDPLDGGFAPSFPIISICLLAFGSAGGVICSNMKGRSDPLKRKAVQPRRLVGKR